MRASGRRAPGRHWHQVKALYLLLVTYMPKTPLSSRGKKVGKLWEMVPLSRRKLCQRQALGKCALVCGSSVLARLKPDRWKLNS